MGRNKMIESPDIMWDLFKQYREHVKANPRKKQDFVGKDADMVYREMEVPLTMEGFEEYVAEIDGMPMTLDHYFSNREDRYSDFVAICSRIKRNIRKDQIEGGMVGVYNPSITQRLNGLADKKEVENTGNIILNVPGAADGLGE
jgi:hypothetical protein